VSREKAWITSAPRNGGSQQKSPRQSRGPFCHFDFRDSDRMRSSSFKNSAVSSAIVLGGGLGGKGITSDIGRTSLVMQARAGRPLFRAIGAFLRPNIPQKGPRRRMLRGPLLSEGSVAGWCRPSRASVSASVPGLKVSSAKGSLRGQNPQRDRNHRGCFPF
jgi:hypothetical protein